VNIQKLCFPEKILAQHLVVLGKTGKGKSSVLRHIVEHLLAKGKRVCIIDPKGDWWGLKSSADGKSAGFPVVAFGDFKEAKAQDVPINPQSGKHVAELIATGNRPCIIGFRGWMPGQMIKFWLDFAPTLFNTNAGELYLVGDEFHNFAPKGKILDPAAGQCLHWSNRIMSEGRGVGLICLIASQRPQKVHNDTLTCCETLIAMGVNHPADRDAVKDWIDGCGDLVKGREVLNSLAGMPRGEAFVWSPENKFGPERLSFPLFTTFDSFAPPQLQRKISQTGWADVNLDDVKAKLATVIEEAQANDPRVLQGRIRELESKLASTPKVAPAEIKTVEVPVISEDTERMLRQYLVQSRDTAQELVDTLTNLDIRFESIVATVRTLKPQPAAINTRPSPSAFPRIANRNQPRTEPGKLPTCERAILTALAQYPQGRTHNQVAILTGYSSTSGGFANSLSKLRSSGFITREQPMRMTTEGAAALGDWNPLPTGPALLQYWLAQSSTCERKILEVLHANREMTHDQLADATGYQATSGGFANCLSKLRTLELIQRGQPIRISEDFFQ
jgi:hypothetical protein